MDTTAILTACKSGDLPILRSTLEQNSHALSEMSINEIRILQNHLSYQLVKEMLEAAISGNHLGILKYLQPIYPAKLDRSTAMTAIHTGSIEIFSLLAAHDPSIITRNYGHFGNPISCAISLPNALEFTKFLLEHGADPDGARCAPLEVPVNQAVCWGNMEVLELLLEHKARLDNTMTLWSASWKGNLEMVRFLLEQGMSPDMMLVGNYVPALHAAVERGNLGIVGVLLEHGADAMGLDYKGNTALKLAQMLGDVDAEMLIMKYMRGNGLGTRHI